MTDRAFSGWPPPVLDPAGPFASSLEGLSWVLLGMGAIVSLIVFAALGLALFGPRSWRKRLGSRWMILGAGLAFPAVVIGALLVLGLRDTRDLSAPPPPGEMRIRIVGEMWWWRVIYLDAQGRELFHDANEVILPVGRPVTLELESADVVHSFWVPRLAGKVDMIPGRRNLMRVQADQVGAFGGQCAEYCGGPHALMGLVVVARPAAEFDAWMAGQVAPRVPVAHPGADVFRTSGCGACHTVRGTEANGLAGPDLTRVGARRTLGAGILPNNAGTMGGWISNSQALKPGNRMPAYPVLTGSELRAVAEYLDGLE